MRPFFLTIAAAVMLISTLSLIPQRAEAAALPVPTGMTVAVQGTSLLEEAAYVCRRVWRCGPYGCGWRRVCSYTAPRYYRPYYAPYYAPRPYYRPYRPYFYYRW